MKQKITSILSLIVLLSVILAALVPSGIALAAPVVVDNDLANVLDFGTIPATRSFYAAGLTWVFYSKTTTAYFTSGNGTTWAARTSLGTVVNSTAGGNIAVDFDGTYVHIAKKTSGVIQYRRAVPETNGTLTYSADWQNAISVSSIGYPDITCDSTDHAWIVAGVGNAYSRVWRNANTDGTWSTDAAFPVTLDPNWGFQAAVESTDSGYVVCLYELKTTANTIRAKMWYADNWYTVQACPTLQAFSDIGSGAGTFSATVVNDIIEVAVLENVTHDITHARFSCADNIWLDSSDVQLAATSQSFPVVTSDSSGDLYFFWENYPLDNHLYYRWNAPDWGYGSVVDIGNTSYTLPSNGGLLNTSESAPFAHLGLFFLQGELGGDVDLYYLNPFIGSVGAPVGVALDATSIGAKSATLNGHCIWDGNAPTTALFMWGGAGSEGNVTYGIVTSDQDFSVNLTGLVPSNWYVYWIVLTNAYGDSWGNLIHFETGATTETDVPIAETNDVSNLGETSVRLNGRVRYDGGLDCVVGFQYRINGSGTWIDGWNPVRGGYWRTDEMFSGDLTNLPHNTTYQYRAQVKNALGTGYGDIKTFTTRYGMAPTPTATSTAIPGIPGDWLEWLSNIAGHFKLIIALGATVIAMVAVGVKVKSKAVTILVIGIGAACVIGFSVIGWYPPYVIILIGGVIGLLILLIVAGGRK